MFAFFQPDNFGSLTDVLTWLAVGGGGTAATAWVVSYLVEYVPTWHNLPSAVKFILPILVSFGLAFGANVALDYTDVLAQIQPYWLMLVTAVMGWISSQYGLAVAKARGISAKAKNQ